jgi:hypothetical protein
MKNVKNSAKFARSSPPLLPPSSFLFLVFPLLGDRLIALLHLSAKPRRGVAVVEGVGNIWMHGEYVVLQEKIELSFLYSEAQSIIRTNFRVSE